MPADEPRRVLGDRESALPLPSALVLLALLGALPAACKGAPSEEGIVALSSPTPAAASVNPVEDPRTRPKPDGPRLGAVAMAATIHLKADRRSPKIGYLRAGGTVVRG